MSRLPIMEWLAFIEHFESKLATWQKERDHRDEWIEWLGEEVLAWNKFELENLLDEINTQRKNRGLSPIDMVRLMQVERMASGHCDYTNKLALYAAELSVSDNEVRP